MYIWIPLHGVDMVLRMATQPRRTLSLLHARTHTITCSSHRSVLLAHRLYTYTPAASSRASSPVQPEVPNTNTNGVGPVHQGT